MNVIVASIAAAAILVSATHAEARMRIKFRTPSIGPAAAPATVARPAPASPGSVALPAAALAAAGIRAARARDDMPTSSLTPVSTLPLPARGTGVAPVSVRKEAAACAQNRKVGAGVGFCELN